MLPAGPIELAQPQDRQDADPEHERQAAAPEDEGNQDR
jgi:hypothetical protein